jgi:hypothetical protein
VGNGGKPQSTLPLSARSTIERSGGYTPNRRCVVIHHVE